MMWRLLMRRCPVRSMTIVGDPAQTGSAAGARSWGEVLDPFVKGRWRVESLTVNYRTPSHIMALGSAVLEAHGIEAQAPESVREGDWLPTARLVAPGSGSMPVEPGALLDEVRRELAVLGGGRVAVIVPTGVSDEVRRVLTDGLVEGSVGAGRLTLDRPVSVLTVAEAKGLEFDAVILVEPAQIVNDSPRGANDLYVAITRPTQRLRVLHATDLPAGLDLLDDAASA